MHTPIEFYLKTPVELYRAGTPTKSNFDYIRTMPPRTGDQTYDIKINSETGVVDHTSGGVSLFDKPKMDFSPDWWVIPPKTELPPGLQSQKI
ncbi:hypothetical protein [Microbulbifer sp. VAAF005]|uniref:hypothetical protein n=1 Tax=Microbulbifer sp. VAAF005 TaxID=3034230 RepID=UPI0024AD8AD3|nr:hypothetical protein [Microbulbifer sp. VAAF005]WHI45964.1 hypothetical protein P0078_19930 [Microbulbifer sp. VAAF005]